MLEACGGTQEGCCGRKAVRAFLPHGQGGVCSTQLRAACAEGVCLHASACPDPGPGNSATHAGGTARHE
jgi:hypothetical protein